MHANRLMPNVYRKKLLAFTIHGASGHIKEGNPTDSGFRCQQDDANNSLISDSPPCPACGIPWQQQIRREAGRVG